MTISARSRKGGDHAIEIAATTLAQGWHARNTRDLQLLGSNVARGHHARPSDKLPAPDPSRMPRSSRPTRRCCVPTVHKDHVHLIDSPTYATDHGSRRPPPSLRWPADA